MIKRHHASEEPSVQELLNEYFNDVDIVLTEGFKNSALPKIEVHRKERSDGLICRGETRDRALIAVASDEMLVLDVPVFDINDYAALCDLIEKRHRMAHVEYGADESLCAAGSKGR